MPSYSACLISGWRNTSSAPEPARMPAVTASCRPAARPETGRRSTTARSVTANRPPSSVAAAQHPRRLGLHRAEPVSQHPGQRARQLAPRQGDLGAGPYLHRPLADEGVNQLADVQRIARRLSRQPAQGLPRRRPDHLRHQGGHVRFGQRSERDHRAAAALDRRAHLVHLRPTGRRPAGGDQQQRQLVDGGGELVPDDQRSLVRPLRVIEHQHRRRGRAQLVDQRGQDLHAVRGRVAALGRGSAAAGAAARPRALAAHPANPAAPAGSRA